MQAGVSCVTITSLFIKCEGCSDIEQMGKKLNIIYAGDNRMQPPLSFIIRSKLNHTSA